MVAPRVAAREVARMVDVEVVRPRRTSLENRNMLARGVELS